MGVLVLLRGWRICAVGAVVACAVVLGGSAVPASAGALTTVFVPQHACAPATTTQWECDAIRLVPQRVSPSQARVMVAQGVARATRPDSGAGPAGGYSPAQIATAYGMNSGASTTQTVAIVDAYNDPSVLTDLDAFDTEYGFPAESSSSFTVVNQAGTTINPATASSPVSDVGWSGEITLDVDAVRGMCHACKILLVEANSTQVLDLAAAVNEAVTLGATIVSNSYGGPEGANNPSQSAYSHAGVAILASSGDSGWYSWANANYGQQSYNRPDTPASFPSVVGVGGTSLTVTSNNTRAAETVWDTDGAEDANGGGASGGGCSTIYTAPAWEQAVAGYSSLGCGATLRSGVDIAADADPYTGLDIYETTTGWCPAGSKDGNNNACPGSNPGWETVGGTSLASPLVAAMWALAGGPANVSNPALSLYGHFKTSPSQVYDVTSGGNAFCDADSASYCSAISMNAHGNVPNLLGYGLLDCRWDGSGTLLANIAQCTAQSGFDGPSGIGTPVGTSVFQPLSPTAAIQDPGAVAIGTSVSFSASGTVPFPGDHFTQYAWNWGDGSQVTTTSSTSASHTYTAAGAYTVSLTATDAYSAINGNRTGQASIKLYTLTASPAGSGSGSVTSSPTGVSCGSTCIVAFESGTPVTLTAHPASGSVFAGWSGGGCSGTGTCQVTMNAVASVTATFTATTLPLTVSLAGAGAGTVTTSPAGIDCGATCSYDFTNGTPVTLTATPAAGSVFAGWSGDCSGTGQCQLTMSAAHTATATFQPAPKCHVPGVVGKTLASAKSAITKAGCSVGTVKKVYSTKKKGVVVGQSPASGTTAALNAPVALKVSKGKKP